MKTIQLLTVAAMVAMVATSCKKDDPAVPYVPPGVPCNYTVGTWGPWVNGVRTRTVEASPAGCTGTAPASSETHSCVLGNRGFISIYNSTANPYRIDITNWPPFILQGGQLKDSVDLPVGFYEISAIQQSGYVLYPSVFDRTQNLTQCQDFYWSFP